MSGTVEALAGITSIEGGWRIKTSDDGRHYVDVLVMLYNFRVATTPAWDGADDSEPLGWNKNGQTGEWREPGGE